jgi:hypothetical protein
MGFFRRFTVCLQQPEDLTDGRMKSARRSEVLHQALVILIAAGFLSICALHGPRTVSIMNFIYAGAGKTERTILSRQFFVNPCSYLPAKSHPLGHFRGGKMLPT